MIRVLAVDDEPMCLEVIRFSLRDKGYDVSCVSSGEEAVLYLRQNPNITDLILLDIMMPGMCGLRTLDKIKEIEHAKAIPIIVQTGTSNYTEIKKYIIGNHINSLIRKPYKRGELLEILSLTLANDPAALDITLNTISATA